MHFDLFGWEWWPDFNQYGLWIGSIETPKQIRSLFCLYYNDGRWILEIFFKRILNRYF